MAPKRRRVFRAAAAAALLSGLGLAGSLGGADEQDESEEDEEDGRLLDGIDEAEADPAGCLSGVVEIRLSDVRMRRLLLTELVPLLPSSEGVPMASALRDLQPIIVAIDTLTGTNGTDQSAFSSVDSIIK